MRRNKTGLNSYGSIPQTVQSKQRKGLDLPELPKQYSRGNLYPSQGGSMTPISQVPGSVPFSQFAGKNSMNVNYQTPKASRLAKKKNKNM
jgi:hypothetical protein